MWICHCNVGNTNRLKQNGNDNIWCHQNMNRKKCVYFDNDPYHCCTYKFTHTVLHDVHFANVHISYCLAISRKSNSSFSFVNTLLYFILQNIMWNIVESGGKHNNPYTILCVKRHILYWNSFCGDQHF